MHVTFTCHTYGKETKAMTQEDFSLPNIWKKEKPKVMTMEAMVAGVKDHGEE